MAFLGGTVLGVSSFIGMLSWDSSFYKFYLMGENHFNNVRLESKSYSDVEFLNMYTNKEVQWEISTELFATFKQSNLECGNTTTLSSPITAYDIYRKKDSDHYYSKLGSVEADQNFFIDYTARHNQNYEYSVVAKNDIEMSSPMTASFTTNFNGTFLIDPETRTSYIFDLEVKTGSFANEIAMTRHDGYGKYSSYTFGERDFLKGRIQAIIMPDIPFQNEFIQPIEFIRLFQGFINNKKEKILKTKKGDALRIVTFNFSFEPLQEELIEQPYVISFDFEEVGTVDGEL